MFRLSPHIEFENYPEYLTSGQQTYIKKKIIHPGEIITAEISIAATKYFKNRLYNKMLFKFCEGKNIIGYGTIIAILNEDLKIVENEKTDNNLNLYPNDIIDKIKTIYKGLGTDTKVIAEIQELINLEKQLRSPRIIRSMIHLFTNERIDRKKVFEMAKGDWRDIIFSAEYDDKNNRIRDFNNQFGKEEIKTNS